ncbi:hypothetical protein FJZ36_15080 [Candidatus Poribacteria bacterium]|nr:hypothetical protein [Candidatus Poribacteria bacterium]
MAAVASSLRGVAASVKTLSLPELAEKGDVSTLRPLADSVRGAPSLDRAATRAKPFDVLSKRRVPGGITKLVNAALGGNESEVRDEHQGRSVGFEEPMPWHSPVHGAELLDEIVDIVKRYAVLPDGAAEAIGLWILHAYVFCLHSVTPRFGIVSPTKRCGKSLLLAVVASLAQRALSTANVTTAAVFVPLSSTARHCSSTKPTCSCRRYTALS